MIKRWGKFLVLGVMVGAIYLIYNNSHTLWDMILNIPVDLVVSYLLIGLYLVRFFTGRKGRILINKKNQGLRTLVFSI